MIVICRKVSKSFAGRCGLVKAVDEASLRISTGESVGLVGESASGKTTLGKMILGIIKPDSGVVYKDVKRPQVIFQDPFGSLDPRMRVGDIIGEGLRISESWIVDRGSYGKKIEEMLDLVKLPKNSLERYPHEFSGGERQRIAIARAVVTGPEFIVCDEPVSSLDVTIQLEILKLLKEIRQRLSIAYLFISHDLRAVKFICDRVAVMKEGRIVEEGPTDKIYSSPSHSYTQSLISAILPI